MHSNLAARSSWRKAAAGVLQLLGSTGLKQTTFAYHLPSTITRIDMWDLTSTPHHHGGSLTGDGQSRTIYHQFLLRLRKSVATSK